MKNVEPGMGCTFQANEAEAFITHGLLDVAKGAPYEFAAQMKSRILQSADPNGTGAGTVDVDAETIFMRSANIDLTFPSSTLSGIDPKLLHFKTLFSAVLRPEAIVDAPFELISSELSKAVLAASPTANVEVEATFTVIGDRTGDQVSSAPFVFPITLGVGITTNVAGTCPLPAGSTVRPGGACSLAQDGIVDCCTDMTSMAVVCPATVAAM